MKWILALLIVALCCAQMVSAWDRNQKKDNLMGLEEKAIMDSEGEKIIDLQEEINRLNEDISCLKGDVENLKKEKECFKERSSKVSTLCRPRPIPIPKPRPPVCKRCKHFIEISNQERVQPGPKSNPKTAGCYDKNGKFFKVDICMLEVDPGPCEGAFPRWFYHYPSGKCKQFIYGGCLGNDNRFKSKKACIKACLKTDW